MAGMGSEKISFCKEFYRNRKWVTNKNRENNFFFREIAFNFDCSKKVNRFHKKFMNILITEFAWDLNSKLEKWSQKLKTYQKFLIKSCGIQEFRLSNLFLWGDELLLIIKLGASQKAFSNGFSCSRHVKKFKKLFFFILPFDDVVSKKF